MENCLFCDVQRSQPSATVVYEDALAYVYHPTDDAPGYLGHLILIPRRHAPDYASLTCQEAQAIGTLTTRISRALKSSADAEKVYAVFYGEVTPHLHIHLTARYPETPADYLRWNVEDWPDAPRGGPDATAALCGRLRAMLAGDEAR